MFFPSIDLYIHIRYTPLPSQPLVSDSHLRGQAGFSSAMDLMQLETVLCDEEWSKTPSCKKPKRGHEVEGILKSTPPPVLGPQSVTCLL